MGQVSSGRSRFLLWRQGMTLVHNGYIASYLAFWGKLPLSPRYVLGTQRSIARSGEKVLCRPTTSWAHNNQSRAPGKISSVSPLRSGHTASYLAFWGKLPLSPHHVLGTQQAILRFGENFLCLPTMFWAHSNQSRAPGKKSFVAPLRSGHTASYLTLRGKSPLSPDRVLGTQQAILRSGENFLCRPTTSWAHNRLSCAQYVVWSSR